MPYALYKDGARISHWYPFHGQATAAARRYVAAPEYADERSAPFLPPGYEIKMSSIQTSRPDELRLARAFETAGVPFIHQSQDYLGTRGLDFKAEDIFFKLTESAAEGASEQCSRVPCAILLQGRNASIFLANLLHERAELARLRAEVKELRASKEGVDA